MIELFVCNTVVCEAAYAPEHRLKRYSIFKMTRMGSVIPKEIKYNMHYDDVRGDFFTPPHGTTPATVQVHILFLAILLKLSCCEDHVYVLPESTLTFW